MTNIENIFRQKIKISNGAKKVEHHCTCCGVTFVATRRDLTYVIVTFLLALRDMGENNYHPYRNVIKYAIDHYNCTPSDYSILDRWKLIDTKVGRGNMKYKKLSEHGKRFLLNQLRVSEFHYQIPHSEAVMYSKPKTSFLALQSQYLKEKEKKEPFFDLTKNNI